MRTLMPSTDSFAGAWRAGHVRGVNDAVWPLQEPKLASEGQTSSCNAQAGITVLAHRTGISSQGWVSLGLCMPALK
jgi:hypothetical protein